VGLAGPAITSTTTLLNILDRTYVSGVARPSMVLGIMAVVVYDDGDVNDAVHHQEALDIHYALEDEQESSNGQERPGSLANRAASPAPSVQGSPWVRCRG
jgi:hypothetical protein